jgi:hypothetical protein
MQGRRHACRDGATHTRDDDLLTFPAIGHREPHPPRRLVFLFVVDVVHFAGGPQGELKPSGHGGEWH